MLPKPIWQERALREHSACTSAHSQTLQGLQKKTANGGIGPHMAEGANRTVSQVQQADWEEDSFLRLNLTTLAGTVIQLHVPVSVYHTWDTLEEYLVEHLPCVSPIETFGCELAQCGYAGSASRSCAGRILEYQSLWGVSQTSCVTICFPQARPKCWHTSGHTGTGALC